MMSSTRTVAGILSARFSARTLQGYFAHKKMPPPRTLHQDYAYGHMVAPGWGAFSYKLDRCRAKMEQHKTFEGLLPESQGQILALTVLYVPYSLVSG